MFGLTAVDGFHIEGMAQNKGNTLLSTEVGEPVPGEDAFNRHDETLTIRGNGLEKRFGGCLHIAVEQDFSLLTQDADIHGAGM
jgi:hypothetical protein